MQIRQFMEQYGRKTEEIEALQAKIAELRAHAEKCTSVLSLAPGGNAYNDSRMEALVVKINDLEQQLGILWEERGRIYIETVSLLCEIPTDICRQLLMLRYLEGFSIEEITEQVEWGKSYIYKMLNQGLEETEQLLKKKNRKKQP